MNPKVEEEALEVVVAIVAVIVVVVAVVVVAGVAVVEEVVVVAEEEVEVDVAVAMEAAEAMEVAAMEIEEVAAYGSQKEAEEQNITIPIAQFLVTPDTILVRYILVPIRGAKVFQKE